MLTAAETARLEDMALSFRAKFLYAFIIRKRALASQREVCIAELCSCMQCSSSCDPFYPLPEDIEVLLHELHAAGLIRVSGYSEQLSFDGLTLALPYLEAACSILPAPPFAMHSAWQPSPSFPANALSCGLQDCSWRNEELMSFISYWQARPEQRNQGAWEKTFALRLLKRRAAQAPQTPRQGYGSPTAASFGIAEKPRF